MLTHPSRRRALKAGLICSSGASFGCSFHVNEDHTGPDAPQLDSPALDVPPPNATASAARAPGWALVLGSGGPRGFVHVGVLKALEAMAMKPTMVVGASVGALVGALYASGQTAGQIETLALNLGPTSFGRLAIGGKERFSGTIIADLVNDLVGHRHIENLPLRFHAVVARAQDRQALSFGRGNTGLAVQASCAIEGMFTPVTIRGQRYHDADLISPVPVRMARALGAQFVLSVDASAHEDKAPESAAKFREGDARKRALTQADVKFSDLNLHPFFGYCVSASEEYRKRCIQAGYEAAMLHADKIRTFISKTRTP